MYYIERESLIRSGQPMFFDDLYSIKLGPIVSIINDQIDQTSYPMKDWEWTKHIKLDGNSVKLISEADESVLSPFEEEIIIEAYTKFKGWSFGKLKRYFHSLKEYQETNSRIPIKYEYILRAAGFTNGEIEEGLSEISYLNYYKRSFFVNKRKSQYPLDAVSKFGDGNGKHLHVIVAVSSEEITGLVMLVYISSSILKRGVMIRQT